MNSKSIKSVNDEYMGSLQKLINTMNNFENAKKFDKEKRWFHKKYNSDFVYKEYQNFQIAFHNFFNIVAKPFMKNNSNITTGGFLNISTLNKNFEIIRNIKKQIDKRININKKFYEDPEIIKMNNLIIQYCNKIIAHIRDTNKINNDVPILLAKTLPKPSAPSLDKIQSSNLNYENKSVNRKLSPISEGSHENSSWSSSSSESQVKSTQMEYQNILNEYIKNQKKIENYVNQYSATYNTIRHVFDTLDFGNNPNNNHFYLASVLNAKDPDQTQVKNIIQKLSESNDQIRKHQKDLQNLNMNEMITNIQNIISLFESKINKTSGGNKKKIQKKKIQNKKK